MKTVLLLRHAKSSWADPGMSDHDRPLNERGKQEAPLVGLELKRRSSIPDLVLSSAAKRARKTAKKVVAAGEFTCELRLVEELYLAAPQVWLKALRGLPNEVQRILAVGHNPGLEDLVASLTGQHLSLPTSALVEISLAADEWSTLELSGRHSLVSVWTPGDRAANAP